MLFVECRDMYSNMKIDNMNTFSAHGVSSTSCWAMCLAVTWSSPCRSVDHKYTTNGCQLSKHHSTDTDAVTVHDNHKILYERCE